MPVSKENSAGKAISGAILLKGSRENLLVSIIFFAIGAFIFSYHFLLNHNMTSFFINASSTLLANSGMIWILVLMTAESALVPIPSEIVMPLAGLLARTQGYSLFNVIVLGTAGNVIGSIILYYIGMYAREPYINFSKKYLRLKEDYIKTADALFSEHGSSMVFFGRIMPLIRSIISLPAGFSKMNLAKFIFYTFWGSLIWNISLALLGYYFGSSLYVISSFDYAVAGIIFIIGIYYLVKYTGLFTKGG